jgi:F-type H+-transporting ATPase subunit b
MMGASGKKAGRLLLLAAAVFLTLAVAAAGYASGSGGEDHVAHKTLYQLLAEDPLPLIKDFLWRVINFAIILWLLIRFTGKPIRNYFANRREAMVKAINDAREARLAAERMFQEYQDRLAGLDAEMRALEERIRSEAAAEQERIRREALQFVAKVKQQAAQMADQEVLAAKRRLKEEAVHLAVEAAEKLVRERITAADRRHMVENYLQEVVNR